MARITFTNLPLDTFAGIRTLPSLFELGTRALQSSSGTEVSFVDADGHQLLFFGSDLVVEEGTFVSGTVTKVTVANGEGDEFFIASSFERDAAKLSAKLTSSSDMGLQLMIANNVMNGNDKVLFADDGQQFGGFRGNDVIIGGDGQDFLFGGRGKDRLTGGDGGDFFQFTKRDGQDIVVDFDAKGGFGAQDFISTTSSMFKHAAIIKSGNNTLIDFAGTDSILLLETKPSEVTVDDFLF